MISVCTCLHMINKDFVLVLTLLTVFTLKLAGYSFSYGVSFLGTPFPKTFMQVAKKILSRLFRVFVHVYIHHFDRVSQMGAEAHVNTCYKHFYNFVTEFSLIDHKELEPLVSVC